MAELLEFRCGHPRSAENSRKQGVGYACRICAGDRRCEKPDCSQPHLARGLCRDHYGRAMRQGEIPSVTRGVCSEPGCERKVRARDLCRGHYQRMMRNGAPKVLGSNIGKTCSEPGCDGPARTKGQCTQHYTYLRTITRHGISRDAYESMVAAQGGRCAICASTAPGSTGRWQIDHDHKCCPGELSCGACVRGLLCVACNTGIGQLGDDPDRLLAAAAYVLSRVDVLKVPGSLRVVT